MKNLNLRDSLSLNFNILQITGYWVPEEGTPLKMWMYYIYAAFIVSTMYIMYMVTEWVNMVKVFGDVEAMTNASFLLLTHFTQVIKFWYFLPARPEMKDLANSLNREIFKPRNERQYKMVKSLMNEFVIFYEIFLSMAAATVVLWATFPFIDVKDGERRLPISVWYPFDTHPSPTFELVYTYQITSIMINAFSNISMDTVGPGFMVHTCIQLDLLNDSLENIYETAVSSLEKKNLGKPKNELDMTDDLQKEIKEEFERCIIHHQNILEYSDTVSKLFNKLVFWQFVLSVIIICITMFQLTLSTQLSMSAWNSNWISCSINYKKDLLFFMLRSHKVLKMYGGNFFTLSLETFIAILRSSWSYFAVLYNVHNRD